MTDAPDMESVCRMSEHGEITDMDDITEVQALGGKIIEYVVKIDELRRKSTNISGKISGD